MKNALCSWVVLALVAAVNAQNTYGSSFFDSQEVIVGVNVINPMRDSVADQNAVFAQLKAAGVHVIRAGVTANDKGMDYAKRAAALGISIQLIVSPQYPPGAPSRPYEPKVFPKCGEATPCRMRIPSSRGFISSPCSINLTPTASC